MSRAKEFGKDMAARDIPRYQWEILWMVAFREEMTNADHVEADEGAEEFERDFNNWLEEVTREQG